MKSIFVLVFLALTSTAAFANNWQRANLRSAEGTVISLDYQKAQVDEGNGNSNGVISPLWINISGLSSSDRVTARLMNFDIRGGSWIESRDITLRFENGRFTGEFAAMPYFRFHCGASFVDPTGRTYCERGSEAVFNYRQELNVQVNGVYLLDPMNGSHNFQIQL